MKYTFLPLAEGQGQPVRLIILLKDISVSYVSF